MEKKNAIIEWRKCNHRGNISPSYYCIRQLKVAKSAVYDTNKRYKELGNNTRPSQNWSTKNDNTNKHKCLDLTFNNAGSWKRFNNAAGVLSRKGLSVKLRGYA